MSKGLPVSQDLYLSWGLLSHEAQGCQSIVAVAGWPHQAGGGYGRVMGGGVPGAPEKDDGIVGGGHLLRKVSYP